MDECYKKQPCVKCIVPSCSQHREAGISFHKFPNEQRDRKRYQKWVKLLKLKYAPTQYSVVCSRHFQITDFHPPSEYHTLFKLSLVTDNNLPLLLTESSEQTKLVLKSDAIPLPVEENKENYDPQRNTKLEQAQARADRAAARAANKQQHDSPIETDTENLTVLTEEQQVSYEEAAVQVDTTDLDTLWAKKERKVLQFKTQEQLTAWTGLRNFKMLEVIVQALEMTPSAAVFHTWDISITHLTILVFVKLKTNLTFRCISSMFDIAPKTASKYFNAFVPSLAEVMRVAVPWPAKDMISKDLPYHFRQYPTVRAVLDCTEIPIQRSNCLHCRILTYSHYKGRETAKYLVSVTPGGCFNYVSPGYVGKASDKFIFNACNIITLFDENDAVMVDKGFSISNELLQHNLKLIRPPTLFDGQLSRDEATSNVSIAGARVHVERSIQRMKQFKILTDRVDPTLLYLLDDVVIILAGVVNLSAPILADNRFL